MSQFNFLTSQIQNRKRDYSIYNCPFCGYENHINSSECEHCNKSLIEYESIVYTKYNNYNEALILTKNAKYISAYENICLFLDKFPEDINGQRLKLFILKQLNDEDFIIKAENYIKTSSDRWVAKLLDAPQDVSIEDLDSKEKFLGKENNIFDNKVLILEDEKRKFINSVKETINSIYSIYVRMKTNKDKTANEFITFYEKTFLLFLKKNNIEVKDYFGLNIYDLSEDEQKCMGDIDTISMKKKKNGLVIEVFYPEIRYNCFIVQRAKLTIVKNK